MEDETATTEVLCFVLYKQAQPESQNSNKLSLIPFSPCLFFAFTKLQSPELNKLGNARIEAPMQSTSSQEDEVCNHLIKGFVIMNLYTGSVARFHRKVRQGKNFECLIFAILMFLKCMMGGWGEGMVLGFCFFVSFSVGQNNSSQKTII